MPGPTPTYPKREGFFAGKFCRLMTKVALANTLGTDVVCLLMVIAHQEDAAGYRGAVTWWNDQLKPLIGVKTDNALIRTRKKATDAGWLHYEPGGKGVAGRYWVTIPRHIQDLDPAPTADTAGEYQPVSPVAGDRRSEGEATGEVKGKPISPVAGDRRSEGEATTILPLPIPREDKNPPSPPQAGGDSPPAPAAKGGGKKPPQRPESVPLPAPLAGSPAFAPAWAEWIADRKARGKTLTELAARQQLDAIAPLGPELAAECVRESIRNGWTGLFPEKFHRRQRSPPARPTTPAERDLADYQRFLGGIGGSDHE